MTQEQRLPRGFTLAEDREDSIYIAGPMSGIKDHNFPLFNEVAEQLRATGAYVRNPAEHGVIEGAQWEDYLRYDLLAISECSVIYLLPGWSKSRGARLEKTIADGLGMEIRYHAGAEREHPSLADVATKFPDVPAVDFSKAPLAFDQLARPFAPVERVSNDNAVRLPEPEDQRTVCMQVDLAPLKTELREYIDQAVRAAVAQAAHKAWNRTGERG